MKHMSGWLSSSINQRRGFTCWAFALMALASMGNAAAGASNTAAPVGGPPPVRTCDTSQGGSVPRSTSSIFSAGRLKLFTFINPRTLGEDRFSPKQPGAGLYRPIKVLVIIAPGADVTLSVPKSEQRRVALWYPPMFRPGWRKIADADSAVTFRACPGESTSTQFGGGMLIARRSCVTLLVNTDGRSTPVRVPFGVPRC